jgi:hypothetical protein
MYFVGRSRDSGWLIVALLVLALSRHWFQLPRILLRYYQVIRVKREVLDASEWEPATSVGVAAWSGRQRRERLNWPETVAVVRRHAGPRYAAAADLALDALVGGNLAGARRELDCELAPDANDPSAY